MTMTKFSRINKQREEITMRVLEDMEKGGNEWKKPWVEASPLPPHNPVSGTQYSGRNFLYTYVYGMVSAVESGSRSLEGELVPLIDYELIGGGKTYEYLPCGCQVDIPMNDSMVAASQLLRNLQNAGVDISKLSNLSCDECSQLAAKVIPYTENKAQSAPDRTLGHKHEVNRDVAQRMQTERTTVNQIREEDTVGE